MLIEHARFVGSHGHEKIIHRRAPRLSKTGPFDKNPDDLIDGADLKGEARSDILSSAVFLERAIGRSIPLITINAKRQITTGSYLGLKGNSSSGSIPSGWMKKNTKKDFEKIYLIFDSTISSRSMQSFSAPRT